MGERLSEERLAEIREARQPSELEAYREELLSHIDALEAEIGELREVLGNTPMLDFIENIEDAPSPESLAAIKQYINAVKEWETKAQNLLNPLRTDGDGE